MAKVDIPDLYKILGVESTASADDIKKAYRRLARELHPDINKAPDADERFKIVKEAFNILGDEEQRKEYDEDVAKGISRTQYNFTYQDVFDMFFGNKRTARQPINGEHIQVTVEFTIYEACTEAEKTINLHRQRLCPDCHGTRFIDHSHISCKECGGSGRKPKAVATPFGRMETSEPCAGCNGYGKEKAEPCTTCESTGEVPGDAKFTFNLPKGVWNGRWIRYEGEGHPGKDGGKSGDLCIALKHQASDRFKIQNKIDVATRVSIPLKIALLGGEVDFVMPNGEATKLPIQKGVDTGDMVCLSNAGLFDAEKGWRGSCIVEFNVFIPRNLSDEAIRKIVSVLDTEVGKGGE